MNKSVLTIYQGIHITYFINNNRLAYLRITIGWLANVHGRNKLPQFSHKVSHVNSSICLEDIIKLGQLTSFQEMVFQRRGGYF